MKKSFTLAEVLIVLTIVGIIATLTSAITISSIPDKSVIIFKKTYVAFNKAIFEVANNPFYYPDLNKEFPVFSQQQNLAEEVDNGETYQQRLAALWSVANPTDINDNNYFCYAMASAFATDGETNCNACNQATPTTTYNFTTLDGTAIYGLCGRFHAVQTNGNVNGREWHPIYMYVNAEEKDPNYQNLTFDDTDENTAYGQRSIPAVMAGQQRAKNTKTNIYRVFINAKAQIITRDEPEKTLTSRTNNNK